MSQSTTSNTSGSVPNAAAAAAETQQKLMSVMRIDKNSGDFRSRAYSLVDLPSGAVFFPFDVDLNGGAPTWATVQMSETTHGDLVPRDLTYINHSCAPTLEFDTARKVVRVARGRDLRAGDELSTFYPSHEWDMSQPFECWCGAPGCVGKVAGAKRLDIEVLRKYWLNNHIERLLDGQKYDH